MSSLCSGTVLEIQSKIGKISKDKFTKLAHIVFDNLHDDAEKLKKLSEIEKLLQKTIKNEHMINDERRLLQPLQNHINNNEDGSDIDLSDVKKKLDGISKKFEDQKELKKIYNEDSHIKKVQSLLEEIKGNESGSEDYEKDKMNEEVTATQESMNLIDPISKKLMENPVRHIPCGHVYDRESTLALIKQRKRKGLRCPQIGCSYRDPINAEDLEDALDYKRELERRKLKRK